MRHRKTLRNVIIALMLALGFIGTHRSAMGGQLSLAWTDNSTNEDGFNIERRVGTTGTYTQLANVAANTTSYTDGNLQDNTTYCYRVRAYNAAGASAYSNEGCVTTAAPTASYVLTVNKTGTGAGTVTAAGINCGTDCTEPYASGTSVVLTAVAASGSSFAGWSGTGCTTGTVAISGNMTCTATFNAVAAGMFPVDLQGSTLPEEKTVSLSVSKPQNATSATVMLNVYDADFANEGQLLINGNGPISLFGDQAKEIANNNVNANVFYQTPSAWWVNGANALRFIHTSTGGYRINSASVQFTVEATSHYTLTVSKSGTGSGTVTAAGINCGTDCTEPYASGTSVVLTAVAASGSSFAGWSGTGCTTGTVAISGNLTCTATFNLTTNTLSVNVAGEVSTAGSASGRVTSNPSGIDCGTDCNESYQSGIVVALTALASANSVFKGWTGDADCADGSVTINANKICTANFGLNLVSLTVSKSGSGTVSSAPGGIDCGAACSYNYLAGDTVVLHATPAVGFIFAGWIGGGCAGTPDCNVKLTAATTVTANFVNDRIDKVGVFRPSTGEWFLDQNGNGVFDGCEIDICVQSFNAAGAVPVVGDWDGSGFTKLGLFLPNTSQWRLDINGDRTWSGCSSDKCLGSFGASSDIPFAGQWTKSVSDRIATFRPSNATWYLDASGDGSLDCRRDYCTRFSVFENGDIPVAGDWTGNGITQVGIYRPSTGQWFLDRNGNRSWSGCSKDTCISNFGTPQDLPVTGDWSGTGVAKIGVFRPATGEWMLDLNGNGRWDGCSVDLCLSGFGSPGDVPVIGIW